MNFSPYFTIGRHFHAYCFAAWLCWFAPYAQAQVSDKFNAQACQSIYQLAPTQAQFHENAQTQWWFTPYQSPLDQSERKVLSNSLALTPANAEQLLDASNNAVLIRWQSELGDALSWSMHQPYFIVREGVPVRDMSGRIIGSFSHLIAKARWDNRVQVEQASRENARQEWIAPLRVEQAVSEVDKNDRVIPRICLNALKPSIESIEPTSTAVATQAQILGLADTRSIGTLNHLAVMDKGSLEGVTNKQTWFLVDALSKEKTGRLAVARTRGHAEIVQVFEHYSLIRIGNSEREVMRGSYLKRGADVPPNNH